jgi:hypothetical protein
MAFAGNFGAAASMLPTDSGIVQSNKGENLVNYVTAAPQVDFGGFATSANSYRVPAKVCTLILSGDRDGEVPLLGAMEAGPASGVNADTGLLVTAPPGADEHGLPANFGPGRGKWTARDVNRVRVSFAQDRSVSEDPSADEMLGACWASVALTDDGTNIVITVRNRMLAELEKTKIVVEYVHSIQS